MTRAALALLLALPAAAAELGGHEKPATALQAETPDARRATLEELWQRRLLPPDQSVWSPDDAALLERIRRSEPDARELLRRRFGEDRPWLAKPRAGSGIDRPLLTKAGWEKYLAILTQDAVAYFERKGAEAKRAFKLRDWDDKPMFDASGRLTDEGARVYRRATLDLEVFWKGPGGEIYGTRRPPTKKP